MITAILWFASCSLACLFGFVAGAMLSKALDEQLESEIAFLDSDNLALRTALNKAVDCMKEMQADLEAVGSKSKEVSEFELTECGSLKAMK